MAIKDRWKKVLDPYLVGGPNGKGETRIKCLVHEDKEPSATINFDKGVWKCHGCGASGRIPELVQIALHKNLEDDDGKASYDPFAVDEDAAPVVDLSSKRTEKAHEKANKEPLSEAIVLGYVRELQESPQLLAQLMKKRGLTESIIKEFDIGYDGKVRRYVIPIRDADGNLINLRRYKTKDSQRAKFTNADGWGSPPALFPLPQLADAERVLVLEGELDALLCIDYGFGAVSGTGGALRWGNDWARHFAGKHVYVCYDNDDDGRRGARKAAHAISKVAASVVVLPALLPDVEKSDVTDWFLAGGTPEELQAIMDAADEAAEAEPSPTRPQYKESAPTDIHVIGSMDSRTNNKPLRMNVMVTGRRDPTYSVPRDMHLTCTLDYGNSCQTCPMLNLHDGDHTVHIESTDMEAVSNFIDVKKEKVGQSVKAIAGIPGRCNKVNINYGEAFTVEELFVTGSIDKRSTDSHDYTQRRVYNVTDQGGNTKTNMEASVVGTTVPSPKDRHNEFFSWQMEESTTSIDTFTVDEAMMQRLSIFQPSEGQTPLQKMREIATDLSENVTGIYGRERMQMAMDLTWHSILQFELLGKLYDRGWMELLIVGETRTGKSDTALRLADHYRLGHVIGCEGATFAGLVGGVKQVGERWTVQWGEITLNDRRLVVLDEASGLSQEIIGAMSDVRSRGTAQLTKVESQQTKARCRMVWISNPRKSKFVDEKKIEGIDIIEDLIGNPEDIARFDLAMSVKADDVPDELLNTPNEINVERAKYTSDLCHDLILWCWSRKPDQVIISKETSDYIRECSMKLGAMYVGEPPLLQLANAKDKLARMSVACAARLFSTDETGEKVVVKKEHVKAAADFVHKLYSYDNFGYYRLSQRILNNRKVAQKAAPEVKAWLKENPKVLHFLVDRRGSFRAQDLEEMAFMHRDEVGQALSFLTERKMIVKDKSQIMKSAELHTILIELEDAAAKEHS